MTAAPPPGDCATVTGTALVLFVSSVSDACKPPLELIATGALPVQPVRLDSAAQRDMAAHGTTFQVDSVPTLVAVTHLATGQQQIEVFKGVDKVMHILEDLNGKVGQSRPTPLTEAAGGYAPPAPPLQEAPSGPSSYAAHYGTAPPAPAPAEGGGGLYDRRNPTGAPDAAALMVAQSGALQPEGSVTGVNTTALPSTHHMMRYGAAAMDVPEGAPRGGATTFVTPHPEGGATMGGTGGNPLAPARPPIQGAEKLMMNRDTPSGHKDLERQAHAMRRQFEQAIKAPRFPGPS